LIDGSHGRDEGRIPPIVGAELEFEEGTNVYRYASGKHGWDLFVNHC
jgi:hypothetical protein